MEVHTEPGAMPTSKGASPTWHLVETTPRRGFFFRIWMLTASAFRFEVYDREPPVPATPFAEGIDGARYIAERTFPNRGQAAHAAEEWCDETAVVEGGSTDLSQAAVVVAGWQLTPAAEVTRAGVERGTFGITVVNATTGEYGPEEFKGYTAWGAGLEAARDWALANPCDGSEATPVAEVPASPTEQVAEAVADAQPEPVADAPEAASAELLSPPAGEADQLRRRVADLQRQLAAQTADLGETATKADEAAALAGEISQLEASIKADKDALKAKKSRLDLLLGGMARGVQALLRGVTPEPYQKRLTFNGDAATREGIAADAAQAAQQLGRGNSVTWPFNGVEYTIEVEAQGEGRFRAAFRGHPEIEGFGETREQAIEHAKNDASIRLEGTDPGSADKTPDAGPVADGPRRPPRKGPFEGKQPADVIAVLRATPLLEQAIERLACTKLQLTKYAKKHGFDVNEHLAKDTALPEPPAAKTARRGGRKGGR